MRANYNDFATQVTKAAMKHDLDAGADREGAGGPAGGARARGSAEVDARTSLVESRLVDPASLAARPAPAAAEPRAPARLGAAGAGVRRGGAARRVADLGVVQMSLRPGRALELDQADVAAARARQLRPRAAPATATWQAFVHSARLHGRHARARVPRRASLVALLFNQAFPGAALAAQPAAAAVGGARRDRQHHFLWMFDASFGVVNSMLRRLGLISTDIAWFVDARHRDVRGDPADRLEELPVLRDHDARGAAVDPAARCTRRRASTARSAWQQFRYVTWPGIRGRRCSRCCSTRCGRSASSTSSTPRPAAGRRARPRRSASCVYREAFASFRFGTAAAIGVLMLADRGDRRARAGSMRRAASDEFRVTRDARDPALGIATRSALATALVASCCSRSTGCS